MTRVLDTFSMFLTSCLAAAIRDQLLDGCLFSMETSMMRFWKTVFSWLPESSLGESKARLKLYPLMFNQFHEAELLCTFSAPFCCCFFEHGVHCVHCHGSKWPCDHMVAVTLDAHGSWANTTEAGQTVGQFCMGLRRFPHLGGGSNVISPWFGEGSHFNYYLYIFILSPCQFPL